MKNLFYSSIILFLSLHISAQTVHVQDNVSGIWEADTIFVDGDISIPKDSTLTISPSTHIYFTGQYVFDVFGTLSAVGTETDSIFFFSDSLGEISSWPYYEGFWYGITFHSTDENGQTTSTLDYCNIKYAYPTWLDEMSDRYGGGLVFYKSQVDVSHTSFTDCLDENIDKGVFTAIHSKGSVNGISFLKTTSYRAGTITLLSSDINIEDLYMYDAYGLYIDSSIVKIKNANIDNCTPYIQWGIVNSENSEVEMSDCEITNNNGIGIFAKFSKFKIDHTLIKNNSEEGGRFEESPSTFTNCEIIGNSSYGLQFKTVQNWGTTFTSEINNCVIAKNNLSGLQFLSRNNASITNCTIADNTNSSGWGGLINGEVDTHLKNCIVYNNGSDLDFQSGGLYTYSIIQGNYVGSDTATTNLQNVNPLFRDATNGDYHLQSTDCGSSENSPGIDTGDPTITDMIVDCASAGLVTKRSDIGAYGGNDNWWDKTILRDCHYMGDVSGVWECDTIFVDGNITIPEGDTLQIKGSVKKVLFSGEYGLTVNGVLLAIGDEDKYIIFDGSNIQGEQWKGISFNNLNNSGVGTSIIKNCRFNRSLHLPLGGAIYINNSDNILIESSIFYQNAAYFGGAIYIEDSNPVITDCFFSENGFYETIIYAGSGGAIYLKNSTPVFHKLKFADNQTFTSGGAIMFDNSSPVLSNILTVQNITLGDKGGAMNLINNSNPKFVNLTCADNVSGKSGGALALETNSHPVIVNSIIYGNTKPDIFSFNSNSSPVITYSIVDSGYGESYFGTGCLDINPTFTDFYNLSSSDCGATVSSPAIDAGHPDSLDSILDCYEGLGTSRADMGYYGGRYSDMPVGVEGEVDSQIPNKYELAQNYPNPFNPSTTIKFSIPKAGMVNLKIYNILGEEVTTLINREMNAGFQSIIFDASHLSSGLYFYRISAGEFVDVKKMLLLK